ncbi:MAG: hypothetical protein AB7S26_32540 [Sandaracinaceae bacterium]
MRRAVGANGAPRTQVILVASLLALGCSGELTQLIVVVDTDLAIPSQLDRVGITVSAGADRMASQEQALTSAANLPLTLAVVPEDDLLGPIDIVAEGTLDGAEVVARHARVTLVRGETRLLRLDLVASCAGIDCPTNQTCTPDGCRSIDVDDLPEWTGVPPRLRDAGVEDAGVGDRDAAVGCVLDSDCDDDNPCTDDLCMTGECTHEPNDLACDDGIFCNGLDSCLDGACASHRGDPCAAPTVCDEAGMQCTGCNDDTDCPAPSTTAWDACVYTDACVETGTHSRTNRTYACVGTACVPSDTQEMEACTRMTAGSACGVGSCDMYGPCDYADACDESAMRTRTCTDLTCSGGLCRPSMRTESMACTRSTTGTMCGTSTCGGYGPCDYTDVCDASANQTRTCMDFACAGGACAATPRMETMACSRTTNGTTCGSETCGSFGACNYSSTCDNDAVQSRTCTTPTCSSGSCSDSSMRTDTQACSRNTNGTSCGTSMICSGGSCISCIPTLSGMTAGSYFTRIAGSGATLTFTDSMMATSSITASGAVTFSGSATTMSCIWGVTTTPSSMSFTDFSGVSIGTITVSGTRLSGSVVPPCSPTPYGCFPPCLSSVVGGAGRLTFNYSDGSAGNVNFACP